MDDCHAEFCLIVSICKLPVNLKMTLRRKILLYLLIVPVVMLLAAIIKPFDYGPGTDMEILYLVIGIPISLVNMWEWCEPEVMDELFGKGE